MTEMFLREELWYETTLVGASVGATLVAYAVWMRLGKPWWEARAKNAKRERELNHTVATRVWWTIKDAIEDGEMTADEGAMFVKRFANTCLPEILPGRDRGIKVLKEQLKEKHTKEVVPALEAPALGLLGRLAKAKLAASL